MGLSSLLPDFGDETSIPQGERKYSLIQSLLPSFISEGYNQTETKRALRSYGFTFTDSRFGSLYNYVKDREQKFDALRSLGENDSIRRGDLAKATRPLTGDVRFIATFDVDDDRLRGRIRGSFALDTSSDFYNPDNPDDISNSLSDVVNAIIDAIAAKYGIDRDIIVNTQLQYGFIQDE